jgi:superfamily I DNA/RNA helicase
MTNILLPGQGQMTPVNFPMVEGEKVLVFTQNEKHELCQRGYNASTVHEVQGETFSKVALVRLQYQQMPLTDEGSEHVTVALSRHTNSLVYYTVKVDHIYARIEQLQNVSNIILSNFRNFNYKK